jgi:hypothetical protein
VRKWLLPLLVLVATYVSQYGISKAVSIITPLVSEEPPPPAISPPPDIGLDEDSIEAIKQLVADVEVKPEENTIAYVVRLAQKVGRPLWQQHKYRETNEVYKKVLKISHNLGSLRGIQIATSVLGNIREQLGEDDTSFAVMMLAYKVALMEKRPFEYGVHETTIARTLAKKDGGMSLMWRLKAKEHLNGTPHQQDYVRLLGDLAGDLKFLGRDEEATDTYRETYELSKKLGLNLDQLQVTKHAQ